MQIEMFFENTGVSHKSGRNAVSPTGTSKSTDAKNALLLRDTLKWSNLVIRERKL